MLFPDRAGEPDLVVCSDTVAGAPGRGGGRVRLSRGRPTTGGVVCEHPDVDVVVVTAPNMLHVDVVEAACASGKHVFCEKPVGGTPEQTARAAAAARAAGVITGVGYNYRFAPLVRHAARADPGRRPRRAHELPRPLLLHVRERPAGGAELAVRAGRGGLRRLLRPAQPRVDLAHMLLGPIERVVGMRATSVPERPLSRSRAPGTTAAAAPGDPDRPGHERGLRRRARDLRERVHAARSSPRARWSARRARWPSTSTARRARSRGTSSG